MSFFKHVLDCQCLAPARTIAEEVNQYLTHHQSQFIIMYFSVNFPVVSGGFALLAGIGATGATAGSLFGTSFLGGAAGILGNARK